MAGRLGVLEGEVEALKSLVSSLSQRFDALDRKREANATALVSCRMVVEIVSMETGVPVTLLTGSNRAKALIKPRFMAIWLCIHGTGKSSPQIGRVFGDRDHTTILAAARRFEAMRGEDVLLCRQSDRLLATIKKAAAWPAI